MKKLLFFSAIILGSATNSEAQIFQNSTNCEIALYEQCFEPTAPCPTPVPGSTSSIVAIAPASTTVAYSTTCTPTQFPVFVIEYTACPGVKSGEFSNYVTTGCPSWTIGPSSVINLGSMECSGCDEADVVEQPGGGVKVGN